MPRLFLSQQRLDEWVEQERVSLDGDTLELTTGKTYRLVAAVLFEMVEGGDSDTCDMLGKVKTKEQLVEINAEQYSTSVILGDLAYRVIEGFVGLPIS